MTKDIVYKPISLTDQITAGKSVVSSVQNVVSSVGIINNITQYDAPVTTTGEDIVFTHTHTINLSNEKILVLRYLLEWASSGSTGFIATSGTISIYLSNLKVQDILVIDRATLNLTLDQANIINLFDNYMVTDSTELKFVFVIRGSGTGASHGTVKTTITAITLH